MPNPDLTDVHVELRSGDVIVLFTDGVTEGRQASDFYGDERLAAMINDAPSDSNLLADHLLNDVLAFQNGTPRDDIAMVVLQTSGGSKPTGP